MPDSFPGARVLRWMLWRPPTDLPTIVLVVRDGNDRALADVLAAGDVLGEPLTGEWGTGQREGRWLIGLRLFRSRDSFERVLITDDVRRELLEAILDVPHQVAIVAEGMAAGAVTAAAMAPRLGESLTVEVNERSTYVACLLAPRGMN